MNVNLFCTLVVFLSYVPMTFASEPTNYILSPTTVKVGANRQRTVTTNFDLNNPNGSYQLTIQNGSGKAYEKDTCSGNLASVLICAIRNLVIDVQIALDRTSSTEITLNGTKLTSGSSFNLSTTKVTLPVTLKTANNLQITVKGAPTASITYNLQGNTQNTGPTGKITLTSPTSSSTLDNLSTTFKGVVESSAPNLRLTFNKTIEIPNVISGNEFVFDWKYLELGPNKVEFTLYSYDKILDTKVLDILVQTPGTLGSSVDSSGGTISVTDSNSKIFGASLEIPNGALIKNQYISITDGLYNSPDISKDYTELGPAIEFYPYMDEFKSEVTIKIPYSASKLPVGANRDNMKIAAYHDGWVIITPTRITSDLVEFKTKKILYSNYKAVILTPLLQGHLQILSNVNGISLSVDGVSQENMAPMT